MKKIDRTLLKERKIEVSGIDIYIDTNVDTNRDYRIFKVLKIPFFPMIIDIEEI